MRILGVDPGTRVAGFGIVDVQAPRYAVVTLGVWRLSAECGLHVRLAELLIQLRQVVEAYSPTHLALESSFVSDNARSALYLGHARGVILAEAHLSGLVIHEISPTSVKKNLTNYGRADKKAVAEMIGRVLNFDTSTYPVDATDALAIAYTSSFLVRKECQPKNPLLKEWEDSLKTSKKNRFTSRKEMR